ncbi:MAG: class I SAM-dependent RNA methyltransferase [Syntrophales bacterium]
MYPWKTSHRIVLTCARGMVPFLLAETAALGFPVRAETETAVETEGSLTDCLRLNLRLRTAHRVLYHLATLEVDGPGSLYGGITGLPWEEYLHENGYLTVTCTVNHPTINDSRFVNMKAKDAIVDRMTARRGRRPDSGPERTGAVVHVHWQGNRADIFLHTSGEPLSRRGYRRIPMVAPMQETLAAGVLMAAGWNGEGSLVNPMCGSGTLAVEGALMALNRAPGLYREHFGFMSVRGFPVKEWEALLRQARKEGRRSLPGRIVATDIDREAVSAARRNARRAGVEEHISFSAGDFMRTEVPPGGGLVIFNPPYGERLGDQAGLGELYGRLGDFLKKSCQGYTGAVFTGNLALAKRIGLRTSRRILFFNGDIECRLLLYELYGGSRKQDRGV